MHKKHVDLDNTELQNMQNRFENLISQSEKSKSDIAKECRMCPGGLSHFIHGYRQPSDEQLDRLARALNTTPDYILFGPNPPKLFRPKSYDIKEISAHPSEAEQFFANLTPEEKAYVYISTFKAINQFRLHGM